MGRIVALLVVIVAIAALAFAWPRLEGDVPVVRGPEQVLLGRAGATIEVAFEDGGSGLRSVNAFLELPRGGDTPGRVELLATDFPGSTLTGAVEPVASEAATLEVSAKELGLEDGTATLVLQARDWSWSDGLSGNAAERRIPVTIDTKPPRLAVESGLTYVRRSGAAAVVYRVSNDAVRSGVRVGDAWFPGTPSARGARVAVFAIPIDAERDPAIQVVAIDAAGNERKVGFDARVQERSFPEISIALSDRFLDRVESRLGESGGMSGDTPLATFQRINTELREQSEGVIADAIGDPTAKQWDGAFVQMRNSSVTSDFAEIRHYTYGGERVSRARHYGFDLASTATAPITASNAGTVIYADDNGIYGTLVLIDHGMGITSLYGHLSSLAVEVGERVEKGQELGRSGATGLAGGDHLHFAILVGRTYVDPVEWWDPKWVREHVEVRLKGIDDS